jgi:putative membrane protein
VEAPLRTAVRRIGQDAAVRGAALVAISPHASWDGLIAAWQGLRVIRSVARLYGLRPGPAVTVALVRKVAWTAAGTAGVDLLSQTVADQALSSLPVARHVLAAVPGSGVAALRLYRLAWIAAEACTPVPD